MDGRWLRPVSGDGAREPRWGHPDGMQVGLHPLGGPRGLLRVYTPYLRQPRDRLVNFIAVEPVPVGAPERGYSELETSRLDGEPGLRIWSADGDDLVPRPADQPYRGDVVVDDDGVERLVVGLVVEPFANGARVRLRLTFRADRPHELAVSAWTCPGSVELDACVLTATMGNWARLRQLHLAGRTVTSGELWPDYRGSDFAEHATFGLEELERDGTAALVRAQPDELEPTRAVHAPGTAEHWTYVGERAVQHWRVDDPHPELRAQVNGRHTYWMSNHPIPGGIAFENLELVEPFREGATFRFGVEPLDVT